MGKKAAAPRAGQATVAGRGGSATSRPPAGATRAARSAVPAHGDTTTLLTACRSFRPPVAPVKPVSTVAGTGAAWLST
jgi:hypothetical protein